MRLAQLAAVAAIVLLAQGVSAEPTITSVRHWTAPDATRIVVDLSENAAYSTRVLTGPDRVVVLVVDGSIGGMARRTEVMDGLVDRVRLNQLKSGAQVVIDLASSSPHNVFHLRPYLDKPHRVVIDVFHDGPPEAPTPPPGVDTREAIGPRVIILDPGHGGEDPGTLGNGKLREKDVVLDIAKRVKRELDSRGGYEVHLTRSGDYFVRLAKRKRIAHDRGGDIFVSIHANSAPNRKATGSEIFYVSPRGASDQAARELADRENAADLVGGVSPDADEDVLSILVDLKMSDSVHKSSDLASLITVELKRDRKEACVVKQAGFLVLKNLEMPSVLVEVGFLSNASDVKTLRRDDYRQAYALRLAGALDAYFVRYAPVVASSDGTHTVEPGETLWSIARRYDLTVDELRRYNGLGKEATIRVDQILTVRRS